MCAVMVAALYVATGGCYFGLEGVDPWDVKRDARLYEGPHPVVAHPPCERWGNYWFGSPRCTVRKRKGDDGGCFERALAAVRHWGGVLEHPRFSRAWAAHGLLAPLSGGGWSVAGDGVGWTCCVEQGHYGHRARKPTWLYAAHVEIPGLRWGRSAARLRIDEGCHSSEERRRKRGARSPGDVVALLPKRERAATPIPFRDLLLGMARSAHARRAA